MGCKKHHGECDASENCVCEVVRAIRDIQDAREDDDCRDCKDCFTEPLGDLAGLRRRRVDTRVITLTTKKGLPFFAFFQVDEDDMDMDMDMDMDRNKDSKNKNKNENMGCVSIFFRVEDVYDGCCARLRVLIPLDDEREPVDLLDDGNGGINLAQVCEVENFRKTHSCVTVDLEDFIAVQCIKDVYLNVCR